MNGLFGHFRDLCHSGWFVTNPLSPCSHNESLNGSHTLPTPAGSGELDGGLGRAELFLKGAKIEEFWAVFCGFHSPFAGRKIGYTRETSASFVRMLFFLFVRDSASLWMLSAFVVLFGLGFG